MHLQPCRCFCRSLVSLDLIHFTVHGVIKLIRPEERGKKHTHLNAKISVLQTSTALLASSLLSAKVFFPFVFLSAHLLLHIQLFTVGGSNWRFSHSRETSDKVSVFKKGVSEKVNNEERQASVSFRPSLSALWSNNNSNK